eukprot:403331258
MKPFCIDSVIEYKKQKFQTVMNKAFQYSKGVAIIVGTLGSIYTLDSVNLFYPEECDPYQLDSASKKSFISNPEGESPIKHIEQENIQHEEPNTGSHQRSQSQAQIKRSKKSLHMLTTHQMPSSDSVLRDVHVNMPDKASKPQKYEYEVELSDKSLKKRKQMLKDQGIVDRFECINITQTDIMTHSFNLAVNIYAIFMQQYLIGFLDMYLCFKLFDSSNLYLEQRIQRITMFAAYMVTYGIYCIGSKFKISYSKTKQSINLNLISQIVILGIISLYLKGSFTSIIPYYLTSMFTIMLFVLLKYLQCWLLDQQEAHLHVSIWHSEFFHFEKAQLESQKLIVNLKSSAFMLSIFTVGALYWGVSTANQNTSFWIDNLYLMLGIATTGTLITFNIFSN